MHIGPYDDEPATIEAMDQFAAEHYLSDVRKCNPKNLKTVIRHPVRKVGEGDFQL